MTINYYEKRIPVGVATKTRDGKVTFTKIISVRNREELDDQVEFYSRMCPEYEPEITETPEGYLLLVWTEKD